MKKMEFKLILSVVEGLFLFLLLLSSLFCCYCSGGTAVEFVVVVVWQGLGLGYSVVVVVVVWQGLGLGYNE